MKALTVDVNPEILVWARVELGVDVKEIANHLKLDESTIEDWENHGREIQYSHVRKIAAYYKRQIPVFFLKDVPKRVTKPKDFRNLSLKSKGLHRDTFIAIRRTNRY